ncbi:metalloprotease FTSH [Seminavis robusta]|uniref:Metalloprotease FTSH n=1 Tax=Seminavis robusta TaxID=568900 RepID=A0A9N8DQ84_9STRA|nr:metalloprotease FTSH [Seminavis robusta]|eukprot:Sro294_g110160.1 metalloprotease FTSH (864) ;mRNA; f:16723-19393
MEIDETLLDLASLSEADSRKLKVAFGDAFQVSVSPISSPSGRTCFPLELTSCIVQAVIASNKGITDGSDTENEDTETVEPFVPEISIHPLVFEFLTTSFATWAEQPTGTASGSQDETRDGDNMQIENQMESLPIRVKPFIVPGITAQLCNDSTLPPHFHWKARRIESTQTLPRGSTICLHMVYIDEELRDYCHRKKGEVLRETLAGFLDQRILMVGTTVILPTPVGMAIATVTDILPGSDDATTQSTGSQQQDRVAYRIGNCETCTLELSHCEEEIPLAESQKSSSEHPVPTEGLSWQTDCPGYEDLVEILLQLAQIQGSAAPSGILLTGSPQVGKTHLASCVALQLSTKQQQQFAVHWVSAQDLLLQATWANESDLLEMLRPPMTTTSVGQLLVLDDLQIFAAEDEGSLKEDAVSVNTNPELLVVQNAVLQIMDELQQSTGTTNRTHSISILGLAQSSSNLPVAFTRSGRLEKKIAMLPPTQRQREMILRSLIPTVGITDESMVQKWAEALSPVTVSCVAGDLRRILSGAWTAASARTTWQHKDNVNRAFRPELSWDDLRHAAQTYVPIQLETVDVCKPKSFTTDGELNPDDWAAIHKLSWESFGGYPVVKKRLLRTVVGPWKRFLREDEGSNTAATMGLSPPPGVLFHGGSGNGKSFAASCLGSSLGLPMIKVRAADVLDKWLGGSEAILRSLFARARSAAPCILFFDEIDSVATNRASGDDDGTEVMGRLLSTLLNEMDGISSDKRRQSVLVVACTNRLDDLDTALLRPGRLEEHVHLDYPTAADIKEMLQIHLATVPLSNKLSFDALADELATKKATGADVEGICREACLGMVQRLEGTETMQLSNDDMEKAFGSSRLR